MTSIDTVRVGEELPGRTIDIQRSTLVRYAGASGDLNRIHWDESFAKQVGLPDVIAHGMFTMGAVVEIVSDWIGDPGRIVSYGTRFSDMVVVPYDAGAQVAVGAVVKKVDPEAKTATVDVTATWNDTKVLARTQVVVSLD